MAYTETKDEWWDEDFEFRFGIDHPCRTFHDWDDYSAVKDWVSDVVYKQKKRDWEEFRELVNRLAFRCDTEGEIEEASKKIVDDTLDYFKKGVTVIIDSKLKEL